MRALLICPNAETINMPALPLGLACVAAAMRQAGHDVLLIDFLFQPEGIGAAVRAIEDFRPDAIGISVRNIDTQDMSQPRFQLDPVRDLVARCRRLTSAPVVLGGAGYSIFPGPALGYVGADFGVQGEGEFAFLELLKYIAAGCANPPGVWSAAGPPLTPTPVAAVLDNLPLPEPGLWIPPGARVDLWIPIQTRRGCPLDCSYCSTAAIEGRAVRSRSPERVVEWMCKLRTAGYRKFGFVDNTFNLPAEYAKNLCRAIIHAGLDIEFWCIVYPKWVDRELVRLMKSAGCSQVSVGFESGCDPILKRMNKRFDTADVTAISNLFAEAGIPRFGFLLLGGPGETRETVERSLQFAASLHLEMLKVTAGIRIYPDTPLAQTARDRGIVEAGDDLLQPRFYLEPDLRDWLPERLARVAAA